MNDTVQPAIFRGRELIDTLWNVNFFEVSNLEGGQTGINRYIMECK